jgi:hypothetical protein
MSQIRFIGVLSNNLVGSMTINKVFDLQTKYELLGLSNYLVLSRKIGEVMGPTVALNLRTANTPCQWDRGLNPCSCR